MEDTQTVYHRKIPEYSEANYPNYRRKNFRREFRFVGQEQNICVEFSAGKEHDLIPL
jgi:hypothetical protein